MAIKTNKDIPVGALVTTEKNNTYVVLVDDAGQRGLFSKKGTWIRFINDTLDVNGGGKVKVIKAFDTLPPLDAVSEAIKLMYTGRPASAPLTTIYTAEDPRVTEAKALMDNLRQQMDAAQRIIDTYSR